VVQEANALGAPHCTLANGLDKPPPSEPGVPFALFESLAAKGSGIFTPPSPAFRNAIWVVSLLNIVM
jgi:hypothetical protein